MNAASRWVTQLAIVILLDALSTTAAPSVRAQEVSAEKATVGVQQGVDWGGTFLGGGVALALGSTEVGGGSGRRAGIGIVGMIAGVKSNGLRRFSLDLQYEPFEVQNPQREERYSSFSAIANGYLGRIGFGVGWQERFWAGSNVWVHSDGGMAFQLTVAAPLVPVGGWVVSPDLFVRISGWDEIMTSAIGLRVPVGRVSN